MEKTEHDRSPKADKAGARGLVELRARAADCRNCDLWRRATQTVFGEGPSRAELMLVGEQPGDQEDREGRPFVGPAGRLLAEALGLAGIDAAKAYITNAVKHFKWTPRGRRRIHQRPNQEEMLACRTWLEGEIAHVRPRAIVALGATAARSLAGPSVRVMRDRGRLIESSLAPMLTVTVHPSSILRTPSDEGRHEAMKRFVADLEHVAEGLRAARK